MPCRPAVCLILFLSTLTQAHAAERLAPFDRPPRSVRSRDFDQQHIRLDLSLDWEQQSIEGRATHDLKTFREVTELQFDAAEMEVKSVELVGEAIAEDGDKSHRDLKFNHRGSQLVIDLGETYPADSELQLTITYRVLRPRLGGHFVVPDDNEPDQARMFWTQSETEYARYWFPCHDSPADRVTSETYVTVPEDYFVLSNGTLVGKTKAREGQRTWHWQQKKTHVPYLFSVVAGEFVAFEQEWDGTPIVSYVPKHRLEDAPRSFAKTPAMMEFFSERIGYRYPWPKYTQICVDEYAWGGMEHTSATTLTLRTLHDERAHLDVDSDNLVAHELVHQWWGDMLTCKDWGEIWLNESFATYFSILWFEHDRGRDVADWELRKEANSYKNEDKNRYRRPIVTYRYPRPDSMFDRHSYPKGGRVLHMLRYVLGDDGFWRAIRHYAHANAFDVVETADLRDAVFHATGQGLDWFFDQWVYHGGHPSYRVRYDYDSREHVVRLSVEQTQAVDSVTPLFRMPVEIEIVTPSETITRKVSVSQKKETFTFDVPERPRRVLFDPRDWILKDLDFEKSKEEWIDQLQHDENMMCRVRAAESLAKLKADSQARRALIRAAERDPFYGVRETAANGLAQFAGDDVRSTLIAVAGSDAKSDVRRAAAKALKEHPHDATKSALRTIIAEDRSYYVAADALRSLTAIDEENCRDDLYAALPRTSHQEVILQAAADGLAKIKDEKATDALLEVFDAPAGPHRRAAVMKALVRLSSDDERVITLIKDQLANERSWYRRAAIEAAAESGDSSFIPLLLEQKKRETFPRSIQAIDDAVKKLRDTNTGERKLQGRVESLEREQRELKQQLEALGETKG